MMKFFCFRTFVPAFVLCCCLGISGCKDDFGAVKAGGTVTFNGEIQAEALVTFIPEDADGLIANGRTDASGKFLLTTGDAGKVVNGCRPGNYAVTVTKYRFDSPGAPLAQDGPVDPTRTSGMPAPPKPLIPLSYSKKETSGLTVTVEKGKTNDFPLELVGTAPK